ncbi:UNVERIFIED_CONTAM: hypothetical protein Sradi_3313600 [Sesamum radiatum]|uniref:Myb/SANT-like domain-containing protein n=1 Tax=Sesamum radiatum TaxID=300843 RepID=A0AAW2R278_SESRA
MAPLKPSRPQKRWLYSDRWTKTHNTVFINMFDFQAERGIKQSNPSKINKYALDFAAGAISRGLNWSFQPKTYLWRLERVRTRYLTFKAILKIEGFTWDKENK